MKSTTTIRRLVCVAGLVLAVSGGAAGGAVANAVAPSEQRALNLRGKALNCRFVRAQDCMTDAELRALMIRSEALNRKHALGTRG